MNGSTWLDRTNYFETLPRTSSSSACGSRPTGWRRCPTRSARRTSTTSARSSRTRSAPSYDNRPYGSWQEKLQGHLFPPEHPYHHPTIGSMADLDAASLEDVVAFFRTYYAPNNAVLSIVGDVETAERARGRRALLRGDPGEPLDPAARRPVAAADPRRGGARDRPRPRPAATRLRRVPGAGLRRPAPRRARHRQPDPGGREGEPPGSAARPHGADRPGRGAVQPRLRRRRLDRGRLGDGPARHRSGARRGRLPRGAGSPDHGARDR